MNNENLINKSYIIKQVNIGQHNIINIVYLRALEPYSNFTKIADKFQNLIVKVR